jgi:hypothetical protein
MTSPSALSIGQAAHVLASAASRALGVPSERVFDRDRHLTVVLARQLAMAAARRHGYSLLEIGQAFDREHTTVLYAERAVAARSAADPRVAELLGRIASALTSAPLGEPSPGERNRHTSALSPVGTQTSPVRSRLVSATSAIRTVRVMPRPERTQLPVPPITPAAAPARPRPRRAPRRAAAHRLLRETVGHYRAGNETRRIVLTIRAGDRVLLDRGAGDERVIERFGGAAGLLQVAAVAAGYLDEARRLGRPVVAARTAEAA